MLLSDQVSFFVVFFFSRNKLKIEKKQHNKQKIAYTYRLSIYLYIRRKKGETISLYGIT